MPGALTAVGTVRYVKQRLRADGCTGAVGMRRAPVGSFERRSSTITINRLRRPFRSADFGKEQVLSIRRPGRVEALWTIPIPLIAPLAASYVHDMFSSHRQRTWGITMATPVDRMGGFLNVVEADGCRNLVSIRAIQLIRDADPCRNETILVVAGREIHIFQPMDKVVAEIMAWK